MSNAKTSKRVTRKSQVSGKAVRGVSTQPILYRKLQKVGGSYALSLPPAFIEALGLGRGAMFAVGVDETQRFVILEPVKQQELRYAKK